MLGPIDPVATNPPLTKVSPVKLMAPLPVTTTLNCLRKRYGESWAGWTEKSEVMAVRKCKPQAFLAGFHNFLPLATAIAPQGSQAEQSAAEQRNCRAAIRTGGGTNG
jgi:hypothetical protein